MLKQLLSISLLLSRIWQYSCEEREHESEHDHGRTQDEHSIAHRAHSFLSVGSYIHDISLKREVLAEVYHYNQLRERDVRRKRTGGFETIFDYINPNFPCLYGGVPVGEQSRESILDGHKYACGLDHINGSPIVYSFGSNRQIDFERGILVSRPDAEIHVFELDSSHMLRPDEYNDDRIVMHHLGLGPKSNDVDFPMAMLQDIMTMLNHTYVDVLKVDIEGGEHIWIEKENPQVLGRVGQLLIEMHLFIGKTGISEEELMKSVKILEQSPQPSMRIFHKELNIPILPASCEISFIQPYWIDWNLKKHLWGSFDNL